MIKRQHSPSFKFKVVMESFQRDTTVKQVSDHFGVRATLIHTWRKHFRETGPELFIQKVRGKTRQAEQTSVEELERIIGNLTVENQILKKVSVSI